MRDTVEKLVALQAIDDEARGFLRERDDLQERIRRLKELLQLMNQGVEEKKGKLAEAEKWYREKKAELDADQDKVTKAKHKLQLVTKNKEYMAMQKEIELLRKATAAREEEIRKLSDAIESFKKSISDEHAKIATLEEEVAVEEGNSAKRIAELEEKIGAIASRKADVTRGLKRGLIARYERIFQARNGTAVVPVKHNACAGCNYSLPPQQMVRLRKVAAGDPEARELERCRNCSRILYYLADPEQGDIEQGAAEQGGAEQAEAANAGAGDGGDELEVSQHEVLEGAV